MQHLLAIGPVPNTEDWLQVGELALGLALSAVIGLEREIGQKSAGLRTHTLVGLGAALFMLVSAGVRGQPHPFRILIINLPNGFGQLRPPPPRRGGPTDRPGAVCRGPPGQVVLR